MNTELKNKVIVITRSSEQAEEPIKKLESVGAKVIPFPAINIKPIDVFNMFDNYASDLDNFDFIVFTSENAVIYTLKRLKEIDVNLPESLNVVCVGRKTADKCSELNIKVDIVPDDFSAKGLLDYFDEHDIAKKKFFIPSSSIARTELKTGLLEHGADVIQTPIYDVGLPDEEIIRENNKLIRSNNPDIFIFTSPSTFENSVKILELNKPSEYFKNYHVAVIGPTTASAVEENGVKVDIISENYTMDDLIDSIINFYSNK